MSRRWLVGAAAGLVVLAGAVVAFVLLRGDGDEQAQPATAAPAVEGVPVSFVSMTADGADRHEACLLLADSEEEREQGLMGVTDLEGFNGMLFEFPSEEPRGFWMRNTPMPLSIAFYDAEGRFVSSHDMTPCGDRDDCPVTTSTGPAKFAVEVPLGELSPRGMVEGSRLERTGSSCRP